MSATVYVWYRVADDDAPTRGSIASLLADVERCTGVAGRLLARVDDPRTWMEVYEAVGDGDAFASVLAERASVLDVARVTGCELRHVERFAPLTRRDR